MGTTIDSLQVEVQSNSTSAVSGIDALASSLTKLKTAVKGGVGLTAVTKQLTSLNSALANTPNADNINKLADSLQKLQNCGNLKLSSTIATQIKSIGDAITSLTGTDYGQVTSLANALSSLSGLNKANLNSYISQLQRLPDAIAALNGVDTAGVSGKINELTAALKPLSEMGKNNLTSYVTQLKKLPEAVAELNSVDIGALADKIQELANAFKPLATEMQSIANGFSAMPTRLQRLIQQTNSLSTANNKATKSYVTLAAKRSMVAVALKTTMRWLASCVNEANEYIESMNLFTVAMGEYAESAQKYAEQVSAVLGIDPAEWMRNQGVFMTLATGFGVAGDRAAVMSQQLTQLGYDLSSFFNIGFEDAMLKLQSGLAGELEPLRRIGFDLSVARLQQEAYTLGIEKKVSAMTQAEKAELRYYAIMTQVTTAHGDMARTINAPANQLRVLQAQVTQCARAIGTIFIPALNAILPVAIAVVQIIREVAEAIAALFGYELPEVDYSGLDTSMSGAADGAEDMADGLGDAAKKAKEVKNALLGIDELNIISPPEDTTGSGSGSGAGAGGAGGLGFELPTYDFLGNAINERIEGIKDKLKELLPYIAAVGAGFAAWKIAQGIITFLDWLSKLKSMNLTFGIEFKALGLAMFLADLNEFRKYVEDFLKNGPTFHNVAGMISEFAGLVGDALIMLGQLKLGGALKIIQGIGEIIVAIEDISRNGINWENMGTAVRGLTNIAIGIGVFTGNIKLAAWGVAIQGFTTIITEIGKNWDAIKQGDWSGVDKVTLIVGGLELLGGLVVALDVFSKIKGITSMGQATTAVQEVATTTQELSTTTSTSLSPNLSSLAKNLGWGLLIVTEVAAAALLITGAIILLGYELEQVGIAWQPVIENGATVAEGMALGAALLLAVGVATNLLGQNGTSLIENIALGTMILGELGIATGLFVAEVWAIGWGLQQVGESWQPVLDMGDTVASAIGFGTLILVGVGTAVGLLGVATTATGGMLPLAVGLGTAILVELGVAVAAFIVEIWAIGKGLTEVGEAWQPVLDNGETIAAGIGLGTTLLIAIGAATAALGVATVASAGLLPAAIGLGTAILVELAAAVVLFIESLVAVSDELGNRLAPALDELNGKLPDLTTNMTSFVDFMQAFAGEVVRYSQASTVAGLSATIDAIVAWFTKDPIEKMADDADNIADQASNLNEKLNIAIPELETAVDLLSDYITYMDKLGELAGSGGTVALADGLKANMNIVGSDIVTGFIDGIKSKSSTLQSTVTTWGTDVQKWFTNSSNGGINKEKFSTYANDIITAFNSKISSTYTSTKTSITTWASNIKSWFTDKSYGGVCKDTFQEYAKNIITGFNTGITSNSSTAKSGITSWASNIKTWFTDKSYGGICSDTFKKYGEDIITGFNSGVSSNYSSAKSGMTSFANTAKNAFTDIISYNAFYNIGKDVINGFNAGINDYYYTTKSYMTKWANAAASAYKSALDSNSPSKVFMNIGQDTVLGYNLGIENYGMTTRGVVDSWAKSFTSVTPTMKFAVDTSALKYYNPDSYRAAMDMGVSASYNVTAEGFREGMEEFYREYVEPTFQQMADDMRRQADKPDQTIVQVGNRTINDSVTTQRKANGYRFVNA